MWPVNRIEPNSMVIICCDTLCATFWVSFREIFLQLQYHRTVKKPQEPVPQCAATTLIHYKEAPRHLCSALIIPYTFGRYTLFMVSHLKQICSKVSDSPWEQTKSADSFGLTAGLHYGIAIAFLLLHLAVIIMIKKCEEISIRPDALYWVKSV